MHPTRVKSLRRWGLVGRKQWYVLCESCEWVSGRVDEKRGAVALAARHEAESRGRV